MNYIGITECGDAALDTSWLLWVQSDKPAILITKNPVLLYSHLNRLTHDPNIIVHCTITGWGGTSIEPNVLDYAEAIEGYNNLIDMLGIQRVVLRIDPIIPIDEGILRAQHVLEGVKRRGILIDERRVRISFLDNYEHVKMRFKDAGIEELDYNFHAPLEIRKKIWEDLGKPEICGEPGMACIGCVSLKDLAILNILDDSNKKFKQRPACHCLALKKELLVNKKQCAHGCLYCYWKD